MARTRKKAKKTAAKKSTPPPIGVPGQRGRALVRGSRLRIDREPDQIILGRIPKRPIVKRAKK